MIGVNLVQPALALMSLIIVEFVIKKKDETTGRMKTEREKVRQKTMETER